MITKTKTAVKTTMCLHVYGVETPDNARQLLQEKFDELNRMLGRKLEVTKESIEEQYRAWSNGNETKTWQGQMFVRLTDG